MQTPAAHVPQAAWLVNVGPPLEKEPGAHAFAVPLAEPAGQK